MFRLKYNGSFALPKLTQKRTLLFTRSLMFDLQFSIFDHVDFAHHHLLWISSVGVNTLIHARMSLVVRSSSLDAYKTAWKYLERTTRAAAAALAHMNLTRIFPAATNNRTDSRLEDGCDGRVVVVDGCSIIKIIDQHGQINSILKYCFRQKLLWMIGSLSTKKLRAVDFNITCRFWQLLTDLSSSTDGCCTSVCCRYVQGISAPGCQSDD